jgi:FlaA1/EpsC-like NDP-sugar epimerase
MISLSGLKLGIDIKIEYSGIRPGEKIEEKLTNDNESKLKTKNKRVFLVKKRKENFNISEIINKLDKILIDGNKTKILAILKQIAPRLL